MYTIEQAEEILGGGLLWIGILIHEGSIRTTRENGKTFLNAEDVDARRAKIDTNWAASWGFMSVAQANTKKGETK